MDRRQPGRPCDCAGPAESESDLADAGRAGRPDRRRRRHPAIARNPRGAGSDDGRQARRAVRSGWSDIDLDRGVVHIRRAVRRVGKKVIEGDTKTHQERAVAVPLEAVSMLRIFRQSTDVPSVATQIPLAGDPFVFSPDVDHARPYMPESGSQMFGRVARKAGLPYHLRQLRHFAATQLVAAGHDVVTVSSRLGHADPSVTLRVYADALEDRDRAAGNALGKLVLPKFS